MHTKIAASEVTVPARHSSRQAAKVVQGYSGAVTGRHSIKPVPFRLRVFFFNVCILKFPGEHFVGWHKHWSTDSVNLVFLFGGGVDMLQCIYNSYL